MDIQLKQLGKRYRFEWIFRNLDYTFHKGRHYAILGPNGSGKSTLLKVLSGHTTPSKGRIDFSDLAKPIELGEVYSHLSYAAPYIELIEEFTLSEAINFHQKFKPLQPTITTKNVIELLGFEKSTHKPIKFFSSGMKQRLKLALCCCSQTELLLLDEPTTNLDAQGVLWYQALIQQFSDKRTIIVASNVEHDYNFCTETLNILDYKTKG